MEGLLARVAASRYREDFVLKGGVLLAAFSLRRPTRDIDLQATGIANDPTTVLTRVTDIAAIDAADGLTFDPQTITAQPMRDDDTYAGVRVRLVATLGRAQIPVGIDVNFGDPIWPAPTKITMPRLVQIGQRPVRILGYPLSMVIAEKVVTALERGEANTRWRDFADILTISGTHEILASELRAALQTVADYRGTTLKPLHLALVGVGGVGVGRPIGPWVGAARHRGTPRRSPARSGRRAVTGDQPPRPSSDIGCSERFAVFDDDAKQSAAGRRAPIIACACTPMPAWTNGSADSRLAETM